MVGSLGEALELTSGTLACSTRSWMAGERAGLATPAIALTPCSSRPSGGGLADSAVPPSSSEHAGRLVPAEPVAVVGEEELEALL